MTVEAPWEELHRAIEESDTGVAIRILEGLPLDEVARTVGRLEGDDALALIQLVPTEQVVDLFDHLPDVQVADLIGQMDTAAAVDILDELPVREQADFLEEMDQSASMERILAAMPRASADSVLALVSAPEGTAGAILEPDVLAFEETLTVRDVIEALQGGAAADKVGAVLYLHTLRDGCLTGVVSSRDLLLSRPGTPLEAIRSKDLITLPVDATLDDIEFEFDEHDFLGLPVIDADGHLLGVVSRSAAEHALAERSESDYRKAQGIVGGEELRSMPYRVRSRRRLSWLSINVVLNVVAASVIAAYQETLSAVIALAAFLPIISDMSGCSGNQAVGVSMRELALGVVKPKDVFLVWRKEATLALFNGCVLGLLVGAVAFFWQQNLYLALVVGLALAINTLVAVSIGGVVPLVLKGVGQDPAAASGPILTTVTDLCGFALTLSLASLWLSRITG